MAPVYLIIGATGSGKSWVCRQLTDKFFYIPHDRCWVHPDVEPKVDDEIDPEWGPKGSQNVHVEMIEKLAEKSSKPIITECPFAEGQIKDALESKGIKVHPIFIVEDPRIVALRYKNREGKPLSKSAFSRASNVINRAIKWGSFHGTSSRVLEHLKELAV